VLVPVPVPAPLTSTPSACLRVCSRQGWAHRPRARDRAAPSERDGAIAHDNCASAPLRTAPVRRRPAARTQPEGPTGVRGRRATRRCARVGDRHAVEHELALVHEDRPAIHLHARGCRELGRVILLHAQPRRESRRHGARDRQARLCAACGCRASASTCACCDGFQVVTSPQELPVGYHRLFYNYTDHIFLLKLLSARY
jgi:hypothetical protein